MELNSKNRRLETDELTRILSTVSKPTRYLGDELNAVKKDLENPDLVRFALAFPDIYDVGMSHLGTKILYQILNSRDDVWAERVFAPWVDMEQRMREGGISLFSIESASPLRDFDIIGFSLQYEMSYTNVLNMLELAQIPLLASDRDENYPLIIAGGPCAFNPEPMTDFVDFFAIGDGEEVIEEIVNCYRSHRGKDKKALLVDMHDIEGVYVPSLASMEEQSDGMLTVCGPLKVRKRVVNDLDCAQYPVDYLVPFMRPIHDRVMIEVMRGCTRGCRFCQAGMIYRPVRERSVNVVEHLAEELIGKTGYEELSLSSLSTCDHSLIYEMLERLVDSQGVKKHVSVSLPSLRADSFSAELARELKSTGKTGLTFAPEVASERMQGVVNKRISSAELFSAVEGAVAAGWDSLKLYFMIGLPTETEEDLEETANLIKEVLAVALRCNGRATLGVSVSTFVPKAHTPFQWERQFSPDEILRKQRFLVEKIGRSKRIKVGFHSPQLSYLEGVFARGDRRLGRVLQTAHEFGCKLDGWGEFFDSDAWMRAFAQCEIDPSAYHRARERNEVMPWDHIDTCLTRDFLLAERDKAYGVEFTPDCRWGECAQCGVCDENAGRRMRLAAQGSQRTYSQSGTRHQVSGAHHPVTRIRFQFAKRKEVKFISHLDLLNTFTRAFRRAGISMAYSEGFSPHPKISFGSVLPVGTTSETEFADVGLETHMGTDDFVVHCNDQLPWGLEILKAAEIPLDEQALMAQISLSSYIVRVPETRSDPCPRIQAILDMDHIWVERARKNRKKAAKRGGRESSTSKFVDIRPLIRSINLVGGHDGAAEFEMMLADGKEGKVRPEEVVRLIFNGSTESVEREGILSATEIQKSGAFIERQGQLLSPMETAGE